ncbi:MAG: SPFH domain-containing protein [Salinivirgaceae bacterium]
MIAIGIILAFIGLVMLLLRPHLSEQNVFEGDKKVRSKAPSYLLMFTKSSSLTLLLSGLFVALIPYLFFFAERGYTYLLVYPSGKLNAVMEQGIKWRGLAKIDEWQKYIDVKVVGEDIESDRRELEGVMKPVPIRFIDQVTANGYVSLRFELPHDKESFIHLAIKFRTMSNLVNNTIIPTVREQLINTGYMFAAQNYISGEAQSFRQTFEEQLKTGTYAVKKIEHKDTIYTEIQDERQRRIKEIQTRYEVIKITENGVPKRLPHELSENNVLVSQVIIDKIDLEPTFKQRLEAQRDESAKRQLEQQKIETAKAAQQRIVAEGERDKAAERVAQEKEQVKQLIAIETKLKQERTNKELAAIALETERLNAQKKKVAADAQFYENAKLVQAGLTPQERAEWDYKTSVGVAAELSKLKFPETMITASEKGGTPLESLIGAAMAKQLTGTKK